MIHKFFIVSVLIRLASTAYICPISSCFCTPLLSTTSSVSTQSFTIDCTLKGNYNRTGFPNVSHNYTRRFGLVSVKLSSYTINQLPGLLFNGYFMHRLELGANKIQTISKNAFDGVKRLNELILRNNQITGIDGIFNRDESYRPNCSHLANLTILDLYFNAIEHLSSQSFTCLSGLVYLVISKNNIRSVEPLTFYGLKSLQVLNLNNNDLTQILPDTFLGLRELLELTLSTNNISRIASSAFLGLENLLDLIIYHLADNLSFDRFWFNGLNSIKNIYFSLENFRSTTHQIWQDIIRIKFINTKNKNDYYDSINLATNELEETQNEYDCSLTFYFITKNLHFNLKNDRDYNAFASQCLPKLDLSESF